MKKIGIITIPDYNNYGNRLQNYAARKFFQDLGCEVDTLELNDLDFPQYKARRIKLFLKKWKLKPLVYFFELLKNSKKKVKRYIKFEKFTKKYLNVKYHPDGSMQNLKRIATQYDYFVLGSDQIWHPTVNTTPNLFFATFAPSEKVLFFAPSFGLQELPETYAAQVKKHLADKNNLTVREESGRRIIQKITGKDAKVLPDPTMCLVADDWIKIAACPREGKRYILKYFLGGMNDDYLRAINKVKDEYRLPVWDIANADNTDGYITGPEDFLGCIWKADYVLTDSFHAVVFCLLFKKSFSFFSRLNEQGKNEGIDSRVDMLLDKFGLTNRKYPAQATKTPINWELISEILNKEQQEVRDYFSTLMDLN